MINSRWLCNVIITSLVIFLMVPYMIEVALAAGTEQNDLHIVFPQNASYPERLAAREIRRYLYLRTGQLVSLMESGQNLPRKVDLIVIGQKSSGLFQTLIDKKTELKSKFTSLEPQNYVLHTIDRKQHILVIAGGNEIGTLYGAYRFAEHLGVRFFLHGDTLPDEKIALSLPVLDECGKPLFHLRGILPFHDFPEGPDWWNTDDYKAIISQLPKMRMNFIGLHTYPEGNGWGPEPTVWIGEKENVDENGNVNFSYPAQYHNSLRENTPWGYQAKKTGDYSFGAAELFEQDNFGPDVMKNMLPDPKTLQQSNELFNRTGMMLRQAFEYAHRRGVKTCIGTETPLTIPTPVKEKLQSVGKNPDDPAIIQKIYEGMFERIQKTHPLDYYWLWTNEGWTWAAVPDEDVENVENDLRIALAAAEKVDAPFTLATCGWVLGPPKDRAAFDRLLPKEIPFSCINREVGKAPVDAQFAQIKGRPTWAIPWLEDDPSMISPQLWVGRMRKDAYDALKYGCTGLMGIHWRTRILGPNVLALAWAGWDQSHWELPVKETTKSEKPIIVIGGKSTAYLDNPVENTVHDPLYQTVRYDLTAYQFKLPNGNYRVKLQFNEVAYNENGKRIFDVKIQNETVLKNFDIHANVGKNKALDYIYEKVKVDNGILTIGFTSKVDYSSISAICVDGMGVSRKINCGGTGYQDYQGDVEPEEPIRYLPVDDFYVDWARWQFGTAEAELVAKIFSQIDGRLPEPSTWINGPGGIVPNTQTWSEVEKSYYFVTELARIEPFIIGDGNQERFAYWLETFRYMKAMAKTGCIAGQLNIIMEKMKNESNSELKKMAAENQALPLRIELVQSWEEMMNHLLATVHNSSEMGTIMNIEAHSMPIVLTKHDMVLQEMLGRPLPADTKPDKKYDGPVRIIVPTRRTSLGSEEDLSLKIIILSQVHPQEATLYWRKLGTGKYQNISLQHIARSVYSVRLSSSKIQRSDFEYYIAVKTENKDIYYPATAPDMNHTVIVIPDKQEIKRDESNR